MSEKLYIGIDNGVTGTIGVEGDGFSRFIPTPVKKEQSYTRAKNIISRIDVVTLRNWLISTIQEYGCDGSEVMVVLERPLVNPSLFKTTCSALRALEATLCVIEQLNLPHMYIDSKSWQKDILPKGTVGTLELKKASMDIGERLFPQFSQVIRKHKDADGMLIAHWARLCKF